MSDETHTVVEQLRKVRRTKGVSQRELSDLSGVPQAQVSRIESGTVDPRISSLSALAHSLGQEFVLVPRKLLPAVTSLIPPSAGNPRTARAVNREMVRVGEARRALQIVRPDLAGIAQWRRAFIELEQVSGRIVDPGPLRKIRKRIGQMYEPGEPSEDLASSLQAISDLRDSVVRGTFAEQTEPAARPAYSLNGDDDDWHSGP